MDLVQGTGGGTLIVPIALIAVAFSALCYRVIQHPKWVRPVVSLTTLLCLFFFILQAQANLAWKAKTPKTPSTRVVVPADEMKKAGPRECGGGGYRDEDFGALSMQHYVFSAPFAGNARSAFFQDLEAHQVRQVPGVLHVVAVDDYAVQQGHGVLRCRGRCSNWRPSWRRRGLW